MNGSNPCIFKMGDKYMINIRFVNYNLNSNGSYHFPVNDGKIATVNKIYELDDDLNFAPEKEPLILIPGDNSLRYVGIEDLKPYSFNGSRSRNLAFMGTIQSPRTGNISIGYGEIDFDNLTNGLNYSVVETQWDKGCEKNWVFFGDNNVIYQWHPLTIGNIVQRTISRDNGATPPVDELFFQTQAQKPMPDFFRHVRGSTHGVEYENEIWFICHIVEYCQPREYYHLFAVFDKATMTLSKWSNLFKFEGEKIEYTLGLIVEEKRIIVSYSKWDREPAIGVFDKFKIEMELFD